MFVFVYPIRVCVCVFICVLSYLLPKQHAQDKPKPLNLKGSDDTERPLREGQNADRNHVVQAGSSEVIKISV